MYKKFKKRQKRAITLLEIMIVILLIGLISGVISYNLKGTLDKGRAFRSDQGAKRLADILNLEIQMGNVELEEILKEDVGKNRDRLLTTCVRNSGLVNPKDIDSFLRDGWKKPYKIQASEDGSTVIITSPALEEYLKRTSSHP